MTRPYLFCEADRQSRKMALLSYLVEPVREEKEGIPTSQFSNNGAARTWAKVLRGLGYQVDVINWDDNKVRLDLKYDLIIAHGGKNAHKLLASLKGGGKLIYYSTGSYWRYHNQQEDKRFREFSKRNKHELSHDRYIGDDEELINQRADAIISLGNELTAGSYRGFNNVYSIEAAGYPTLVCIPRIVQETSKHFLFLSGPGNIHKGLDIILEAFRKTPELHLHIVTTLNADFIEYYRDDLFNQPNIHTYGYVTQRSSLYYAIIRQCSFSILMSCSEGSPGSVVESMQQGLIPILSESSHLDPGNQGYILREPSVENIRRVIKQYSNMPITEIEKLHKGVYKTADRRFSIDRFEKELARIIVRVTGKPL